MAVSTDQRNPANGYCFVAMPGGGSDPAAVRQYQGWYALVIEPAILALGLKPYLAMAQDAPVKISDDFRQHLYEDELAFFDLAGLSANDAPNANVMYELGLRHAFGYPSVLFAWDGAKLPFDIGEQRAIARARDIAGAVQAKAEIEAALRAAREGRYYRPMESIANAKLLAKEGETDAVIKAIAEELKVIKASLGLLNRQMSTRRLAEYLWKGATPNLEIDPGTPWANLLLRNVLSGQAIRESEKHEKQGERGDDRSVEDAREKKDDDQP
jgi:hypothetical protein